MKLTPSMIRTTYSGRDFKSAELVLPDGREYAIAGDRSRQGLPGRRYYHWSFRIHGPGIAHAATKNERILDMHWGKNGERGAPYQYLHVIRLAAQNLTDAKRRLVALLGS